MGVGGIDTMRMCALKRELSNVIRATTFLSQTRTGVIALVAFFRHLRETFSAPLEVFYWKPPTHVQFPRRIVAVMSSSSAVAVRGQGESQGRVDWRANVDARADEKVRKGSH